MNKTTPFNINELERLRTKYSTPYYIYDGDGIKTNALNYMDKFRLKFDEFQQFYAVKALPNPTIIKLLKDCGMGFDCSSPEEIKLIRFVDSYLDTFSPKSKIFYTSNFTSSSDIKFALDNDCILNLDDIDGLDNLINTQMPIPSTICFRYNPAINVNPDVKSNNFVGTKSKFGMDKQVILNAYEQAKLMGITDFGLHTMCVSNELNLQVWENIISSIFKLVDELKQKYSIQIQFINIGGGLGIPYKPEQQPIDLDMFVSNLKNYWEENINKYNISWKIKLFTECGRYITGSHGYLVSTCKSIKKTSSNQIFYGLDACMANLMRPGMYGSYHHISVPKLETSDSDINNQIKANVVGTLCENNDWFCSDRNLPHGIKKNDLFVIHDAGAHAFSMGFNYNSKLKSSELLKLDNKIELIRIRENFNDLTKNYICKNELDDKFIDILLKVYFVICFILIPIITIYHIYFTHK